MLLELNIENFAIIKDLYAEFTSGLNIITGETGTGKSILIEALSIILGSRTSKDLIRTGEEEAHLEAVFHVENEMILDDILGELGINIDEDRILIISRQMSLDRPSISKINGKTVNLSMLDRVTSKLVDIFGQFEHQSLLNVQNHKRLLDSFGDEEFNNLKLSIREKYILLKEKKEYLKSISMDKSERDREIDILQFQIDEIEEANLDIRKDELVEEDYKRLLNLNKIGEAFSIFYDSLNSTDFESVNILELLNKNILVLEKIKDYDEAIVSIYERLKSVKIELEDVNREGIDYIDNLNFNEQELFTLENRLDTINKLKNKYGKTIEDVLVFRDDASIRLEALKNQETEMEDMEEEILKIKKDLEIISLELSGMRKAIASRLEDNIQRELEDLSMENVRFKVDFERTSGYLEDGIDQIEFLISTNIGENLKPLSRIASGGEMSRIMLGFKSILAEYDNIQTMIFDEIDTGISGRTAQIVGEKIYEISRDHQVICISHLPQITALADSHYLIVKEVRGDKTGSSIKKLSYEDRIEEMARLIGGVDVTETTKKHAIEMIEMSKSIK